MIKFTPIEKDDIEFIISRKGRIAGPIIEQFMDSDLKAAKISKDEMSQTVSSLYTSLKNYIESKCYKIEIRIHKNEIYLMKEDE